VLFQIRPINREQKRIPRVSAALVEAAILDHREQIVLQGALNALPRNLSVSNYRFRHIADRLAQRGLLKIVHSTTQIAQYSITPAGQGKLTSLHTRAKSSGEMPDVAAE
jgi:hypothetical protein